MAKRFELTKEKLQRLLEVSQQRLEKVVNKDVELWTRSTITVVDASGSVNRYDQLDAVFEHENRLASPIVRIDLSLERVADEAVFAKIELSFSSRGPKETVAVQSADPSWAFDTFKDCQDQMERAFTRGPVHKNVQHLRHLLAWGIMLLIPAGFLLAFGKFVTYLDAKDPASFSKDETEHLQQLYASNGNSDDRLDFIAEYLKSTLPNVESYGRRGLDGWPDLGFIDLLPFAPIAVGMLALWHLAYYCYPDGVFAWGDFGDHYADLQKRRSFIWTTVIATFVVGIGVNLALSWFD